MRPGIYGNLFDNEIDGLGTFGRRMGIYYLSGLKDDHRLAALAQTEIFSGDQAIRRSEAGRSHQTAADR